MKFIRNARNLSGKRVLVRVDFNVPLKGKKILDDTRLHASLPTIEYLAKKGAKVILVTHVGRPDGKIVSALKVDPIANHLWGLLGKTVKKLETGNWKLGKKKEGNVMRAVGHMKAGAIAILENIRFSPDEKKNTGMLATDLASLADVFVLDGFAVAHRGEASVAGVAKYLPSYAGLLLEKEISGLQKALKPKKPFVVVLGGAKIETKIPILKNLLPKADTILIGGGLVNTYLKAKGYGVGDSLVDADFQKDALKYCGAKKVVRPVDVLVGASSGERVRVVNIGKRPHLICKKGEGIFDVGPNTIRMFAAHIKKAQTLVWNGAMGYFEQKPYDVGTLAIARLVASRSKGKAFGVIGGGETLQAMDLVGMKDDVDF